MTHLTGFPCSPVRRGARRGVAHHKQTATQRADKGNRHPVGRGGPPRHHQMGHYQRSLVLSPIRGPAAGRRTGYVTAASDRQDRAGRLARQSITATEKGRRKSPSPLFDRGPVSHRRLVFLPSSHGPRVRPFFMYPYSTCLVPVPLNSETGCAK